MSALRRTSTFPIAVALLATLGLSACGDDPVAPSPPAPSASTVDLDPDSHIMVWRRIETADTFSPGEDGTGTGEGIVLDDTGLTFTQTDADLSITDTSREEHLPISDAQRSEIIEAFSAMDLVPATTSEPPPSLSQSGVYEYGYAIITDTETYLPEYLSYSYEGPEQEAWDVMYSYIPPEMR